MPILKKKKQKIKDKTRIDKKESDRHYKGKLRLAKILATAGFTVSIEKRLPVFVSLGEFTVKYRADVYAKGRGRAIICEVDGYQGHKSRTAKSLQNLRLRRIRERYGAGIEEYRFTLKRLSAWTDEEIAKEMKL